MKEKKEIDGIINKLVEKELEAGESHDSACDEFNNESNSVKQDLILIDKIIPIEMRTVLLMNSIDALNWICYSNHPAMHDF